MAVDLVHHERQRGHLDLLLRQAQGKDHGNPTAEDRNLRRRVRAGVRPEASPRRNQLNLDEEGLGRRRFRELKGLDADDEPEEALVFCRCILGWRVGPCGECALRAAGDGSGTATVLAEEAQLRKRVFASCEATEAVLGESLTRKQSLMHGLSSRHLDLERVRYDAKAEAEAKRRKMGQDGALARLRKLVVQQVKARLFMSDEMRRKRSPLVDSKRRSEHLSRVFVLGHEVVRPTVAASAVLEKPASFAFKSTASIRSRSSKLGSKYLPMAAIPFTEENIAASSPLHPSSKRRPTITLVESTTTFLDKRATKLRERGIPVPKRLAVPESLLLPKRKLDLGRFNEDDIVDKSTGSKREE